MKDKGKKVMENFGEKRTDMLRNWEEKSSAIIDAFLLLFGRDGRLVRRIPENQKQLLAFIFLHLLILFIILTCYFLIRQLIF